jgi:hypothetical protein
MFGGQKRFHTSLSRNDSKFGIIDASVFSNLRMALDDLPTPPRMRAANKKVLRGPVLFKSGTEFNILVMDRIQIL